MSEPQPDYTGLQGYTPDPGPVASGTVPSGQIASWLTENIPQEFRPPSVMAGLRDPSWSVLQGGASPPWAETNNPILSPLQLSGPDVLSTQPERGAALQGQGEVLPPGTIPGTMGLVPADLAELLLMGGGAAMGGIRAAKSVREGLMRNIMRYRLGSNPGAGFENIAATLQRVAPGAMRPVEQSAQGISDAMRSGVGIKALGDAKGAIENTIKSQLNTITAAAQQARAQGLTGQYAARAAAGARDLAKEFGKLIDELKDVNQIYSRTTRELRNSMQTLPKLREREEIYQDIQALLAPIPGAFQRWFAKQTDYAKGATLQGLFQAAKPVAAEAGRDVLDSQRALQLLARARQKVLDFKIDPELLKSIFRGGETMTPDVKPRIRLPLVGRVGFGTSMAGPVGQLGTNLAPAIGGAAGAVGARAAQLGERYGLTPFLSYLNREFNPYYETPPTP